MRLRGARAHGSTRLTYNGAVRVYVVESTKCSPGLREGLRAALAAAELEVSYETDGGGNAYARILEADAVVVADSGLSRVVAMHFGWAVRGTPTIVIRDPSNDPLVSAENAADERFLEFDAADPRFGETLRLMLDQMRSRPDDFRSVHTRRSSTALEGRSKIFVSYSHADSAYLDRLLVHLKPLHKLGDVAYWSDQQIRPGKDWKAEINTALQAAGIAILLISPDFLASDFIVDHELKPLLAAAQVRGTRILPIVVRPCRYLRDPELSVFQAFNSAQPIGVRSEIEQDAIWDSVAHEIERSIANIVPGSTDSV